MTRSGVRCVLAAILFCCAAFLPSRLAGQLDDLLSSLLSGGKEGKIRAVSVASQAGDRVVLLVRYSDVRNPSALSVTARVLESKLKELDGFEVSTAEVVGAEGSVEVTVAYTGSAAVTSALVEARLVRADGRAVAVQVAPIVRRWTGTGGGEGSGEDPGADTHTEEEEGAGSASASGSAGGVTGSPSSSSGGAAAPREFLIHPTPLPGTPAVDATAPAPPTPAPTPPATGPVPPDRGGGRRPVSAGGIRRVETMGTMVAASPMLLHVAARIDLYAMAASAEWSNGSERLPFNGSPSDARGFARGLGRARLADGRDYDNVLQTHPRWGNEGRIEGAFQLSLPPGAQALTFGLGFLPGADGSDGVRFQVACESEGATTLWLDEAIGPGSVVQRRVAVPASMSGRAVRLRLITLAGASSGRDWAVWVAPRVD